MKSAFDKIAAGLRDAKSYREHLEETLKEPIPDDLKRLLDALK